jgi:hypothetical protein
MRDSAYTLKNHIFGSSISIGISKGDYCVSFVSYESDTGNRIVLHIFDYPEPTEWNAILKEVFAKAHDADPNEFKTFTCDLEKYNCGRELGIIKHLTKTSK